ncbi:hypothetical protein OF83DRAFT_1153605 [Amylostereum chailletii]|nr:hypothetical protein OF83DRAFT_1153605 [Amylostereum chailletii]
MSKQPKPSALRTLPKSGNSSFNMAKDAGVNASKCVGGTLILRYSEVIFPKSNFTHLVVTMPAFHFTSKAGIDEGGCGWNKTVFPVSEGKTRDVFFHTKSSGFQYLGTYKCVVTPELAMRHVKTIEGFDSLHYGSIITRTAPSSPKCPKGLAKAVKALYKDDVLQVACVGLQCVGYDPDVNAALFSLPFKPSKVSDPGPSKKRKREGNSAGKGRSAKRSKKNSK